MVEFSARGNKVSTLRHDPQSRGEHYTSHLNCYSPAAILVKMALQHIANCYSVLTDSWMNVATAGKWKNLLIIFVFSSNRYPGMSHLLSTKHC